MMVSSGLNILMSTKTFTTIDIENKTYDGEKQKNSNYYPCEYPCSL
jgi:hypothetical protein